MPETVCVSSPTLTSTQVTTSHSLRTTTHATVVTLPASVLTSIYTTCAVSPNTTSCLTSSTLITQRGGVSTQIVTVTDTVDVPVTALATLYGSSCRTVSSTTVSTPDPYTTPTEPTPLTTSTITTTSYSTFTGTSLVTSDGSTFTSYYTSISFTIPPVSSSSDGTFYAASTTSTIDPFQANPTNTPAPGNNTGAIVGGTLGGIAALGLLALLTWQMIKKSHRFDNLFKEEDTNYYGPPPKTPPMNPYQYGLVGQQDTQAVGFSPPGSPGLHHANLVNEMGAFNTVGNDQGVLHTSVNSSAPLVGLSGHEAQLQGGSIGSNVAYNAPNQASVHHIRNPSAVPLLVGLTSAAAGGAAVAGHSRPNTGSTRPNTGSSRASVASDPIGPLITHALPPQNIGYPPQQFNSYPPALAAYAQQQGLGQPQVQPQQNLGHNTSVGSSVTFSAAGSSSGSHPANFVPIGAGSVLQRPTSISQQSQLQRYEDPFARSGSPIAYQDRQVLQVMNAENMSVEGSSSSRTFSTPGLSVAGPSTSSFDGKGRPFNSGGEKAPLVHLDGGAYEERPRTPAPPAYME